MATKHIVHDNKVYKEVSNDFFSSWEEVQIESRKPSITWHRAKIPFSLWRWMTAFCQVTQEKFKSEAFIQLFYDTNTDSWMAWAPPQETMGMTVHTLEDDPRYAEQRKSYPDMMAGTLHHHCTSSAFQSGVDENDENDKEGVHFTIGHLGKETHSIHARFCTGGSCIVVDALDFVDFSELGVPDTLPERLQTKIHETMLTQALTNKELKAYKFETELKNIEKKTYNRQRHFGGAYGGSDWWEGNYQDSRYPGAKNNTNTVTTSGLLAEKGKKLLSFCADCKDPKPEDEGFDPDDIDCICATYWLLLTQFLGDSHSKTLLEGGTPRDIIKGIEEALNSYNELVWPESGIEFRYIATTDLQKIRRLCYTLYQEVLAAPNTQQGLEDAGSIYADLYGYLENHIKPIVEVIDSK